MPNREHGGHELVGPTQVEAGLVNNFGGLLERRVIAAGRAQRPDGERGDRGGGVALAYRVANGQPESVVVVGVIEEVAADLIARKHAAGDVGAGKGGDARRQQVLLDLGRGVMSLRRRARWMTSV